MGQQQEAEYYDRLFSEEGYHQEAHNLRWYPVWKSSADEIVRWGSPKIVDLGCGPGHLAEIINRTNGYPFLYIGYDFSRVAIDIARAKVISDRFDFRLADLSSHDFNESVGEARRVTYVSTEFLEHVEFDLEVIERIPSENPLLFSLPRFDDPGHVRFFTDEQSIRQRYGGLLNIYSIQIMPDNWRYCVQSVRR